MTDSGAEQLLTIDELSALTGLSVRTTRYYASLGLVPPPVRRGRIAYYGREHRARLELVTALQEHGFTLQAIDRYLARLPKDVTVEDLAMQRAMITSWTTPDAEQIHREIGRELRRLGVPRETLAAAEELIARHLDALAADLRTLVEDRILDPWQRTHHSADEVALLEEGLPKLRDLTVQAVTVAFQGAVNRAISRSLQSSSRPET